MIWVIGANGMLGSEICNQLEKNHLNFVSTDRDVDITNLDALKNFITNTESNENSSKIKWIINCAAYTAVEKAETDQELAYQLNAVGPKNIAQVARDNDIKLIHISTDYVFGGKGNSPFTEDMKKNPLGIYGKTKSDGEDFILQTMTQFYIVRTAWLYGFAHPNFVYTMTKLMNSKSELKVVNDQFGTPTNACDLANAILTILKNSEENNETPYGIYNFSNLGEISWFDFAQKIYSLGKKYNRITNECNVLPCTTQEFGAKVERPAYSVLSKEKIMNALKIKIPAWEESLENFIKSESF